MMNKVIGICSDHAGFELKEFVKALLEAGGIETVDFGCFSSERADYPDYAHLLGNAIDKGELKMGIAICGSGNGICMTLNKHFSVRAALCWSEEIASLSRQHNDANVLCLPARFITLDACRGIVEAFLSSSFEGGRHAERVEKISLRGNNINSERGGV